MCAGLKAVKALRIPGGAGKISRSQMDKYQVPLKTLGAGIWLSWN